MPASAIRRDLIAAVVLAIALGVAWTWRDWTNLTQLRLPDTDDVVRLQQIRDWLGGQRFGDLTQYRLGGGVPMHWSRLADLVPAVMIALVTPFAGPHAAEVAAVIVSPLLLFAAALFLVARIARTLGDDLAATACLVAAIGFPATTLFVPGRIDHHALQMVFLLGATLSLLGPAGAGAGVVAGLLAAASLVIGLETAPMFAVIGTVAAVDWALARRGAGERLQGLGIGALVGLAAGRGIFATSAWAYPACDGFTGEAWRAAVVLSVAPLILVALDRHLPTLRTRAAVAVAVAAVAGGVAVAVSPGCLTPYAGIDPVMARLWLARVGEAQPLFAAPTATAFGYAGLMIAGAGASAWRLRATRARGWAVLLALQLGALALTCVQLRGAYAGALLAAPGLAAAIAAARRRGGIPVAAAWLASAGMLYPLAADALTRKRVDPDAARGDCASASMVAMLNTLRSGVVIAPIDAGAYLLAGTRQHLLAAPYHRNDAANLSDYRFYLGDARIAAAIADRAGATYWLSCTAMPGDRRAAGLAGWKRLAALPDGAAIWARDTLPGDPAQR